jgi:hypothetical protein
MAIQYSTALKNRLLGGGTGDEDIKSLFSNSYIVIYNAASVPDVDSETPGTVLAVIGTKGTTPGVGTGLALGSASSGAISKDSGLWGVAGDFNSGAVDNPGGLTATHFRLVADNSLVGSAAVQAEGAIVGTTALRLQGTCGATAAADMVLSVAAPADDAPLDISSFTLFF